MYEEERHRQLVANIKKLRKAKGWSARELNKRAGLPEGTINKIEAGRRNPALDRIAAIARALDVSLSEFLAGVL